MAGLSPTTFAGVADPRQAQSPLGIGPVQFVSQEMPSSLVIGLEQILAVHDYIGGARVIQALGPRAKDITWEGKLRGSFEYIDARNRQMLQLDSSGQVTTVAWKTYAYDGIVMEWEPDWKHEFRLDYRITLKVLRDQSGTYASTSGAGADSQALALYNGGVGQFNALQTTYPAIAGSSQATLLSTIQTGLAALGQALAKAGPLAGAVGLGNAGTILSVLGSLIPSIQSYLSGLGTTAPAGQIIGAQQLLASVVLIQKLLQGGQAATTLVVFGGSLYTVAAQLFGNPGLAGAIAAAQTPPLLTMRLPPGLPTTLVIPPLGSTSRS